jgi:Na+-translocating ferredoxin:NAD+ oxidoreductase RnfG subunit
MSKRNWSLGLLPVAAIVAPAATSTFLLPSFAYAADYLTVAQAQAQLFPSAKIFVEKPLHFSDADRDSIKSASGMRQRWEEQKVWRAERDGDLVGWFIVDDVIGKHEFITYGVAISPDGKVLGIEILSYRETHGGQVRDAQWRKSFVGKKLGDQFKLDEDVPNISGATLSCRNVLDGVKRLLTIQKLFLARG